MQENKEEVKSEAPEGVSERVFATIDDFQKIEIRLGTVLSVEVVEGADKLYILKVDFGLKRPEERGRSPDQASLGLGEDKDIRQILSGIREFVQPDELLNKQFPFVTNLAPRMLRGHESQGMILAGSAGELFSLLNPTVTLPNGTRLR